MKASFPAGAAVRFAIPRGVRGLALRAAPLASPWP